MVGWKVYLYIIIIIIIVAAAAIVVTYFVGNFLTIFCLLP
jgi:hypothetical protein